ncbi:hypothetical protein GCM10008915_45240 [Bifidobacterium pullorum subsp. gallinarum]
MNHLTSIDECRDSKDRLLKKGCMLKALYMKENNCMFSPSYFSLQDIIQLTGQNSIPDLDKVMFIYTLNFVVGCNDASIFQHIDALQLQKLLKRVDDVLIHLSGRVASNPSELYRSIF